MTMDQTTTHKVSDKEIENEGKVALTIHFDSVSEMMLFVSGRMGTPVRPEDALDKVQDGRRFVLDRATPDELRVRTFVTTEETYETD